jgi:hypothetical protein
MRDKLFINSYWDPDIIGANNFPTKRPNLVMIMTSGINYDGKFYLIIQI